MSDPSDRDSIPTDTIKTQNSPSVDAANMLPDNNGATSPAAATSSEDSSECKLLSIPPEMRNLIYEQCLRHDRRSGRLANPALLATCKQIYGEAKQFFYAESAFSMNIETTIDDLSSPDGPPRLKVTGDLRTEYRELLPSKVYAELPKSLKQAPTVKVELFAPTHREAVEYFPLSNFLYTLCNFTSAEDSKVKRFEFRIKTLQASPHYNRAYTRWPNPPAALKSLDWHALWGSWQLFYPLAKLGTQMSIYLPGLPVPFQYWKRAIIHDRKIRRDLPEIMTFRAFDRYLEVKQREEALTATFDTISKSPKRRDKPRFRRLLMIDQNLGDVARGLTEGFDGPDWYRPSHDAQIMERLKWASFGIDLGEKCDENVDMAAEEGFSWRLESRAYTAPRVIARWTDVQNRACSNALKAALMKEVEVLEDEERE